MHSLIWVSNLLNLLSIFSSISVLGLSITLLSVLCVEIDSVLLLKVLFVKFCFNYDILFLFLGCNAVIDNEMNSVHNYGTLNFVGGFLYVR